jgi:hypothetical protein
LADDTEDEMKKIATVLERNSLAIIDWPGSKIVDQR